RFPRCHPGRARRRIAAPWLIFDPSGRQGCGERSWRSRPPTRSIACGFANWALRRTMSARSTLPLTRKEDYISDPEAFRLRPRDLPADCSPEERVLWDIAYTTGTTSG